VKYWVYLNGEVPGSFNADDLVALPEFSLTTLICPAEGEILEKNWQPAGEFDDIARRLSEREGRTPEPAPSASVFEPTSNRNIDALIDSTSNRLFAHVSALMKDLSSTREEKALALSLQEQLSRSKEEIKAEKAKAASLETRLLRIGELEESLRKDQAAIQSLQTQLHAREEGLTQHRLLLEKAKADSASLKNRLDETSNNLAVRNHLIEKLNHDLIDKEQSLSKALSVMHRLEEDLKRLYLPKPETRAASMDAAADFPKKKAHPEPAERKEVRPEKEPAAAPSAGASEVPPAVAHEALIHRFRKFVTKYDH
jgi:hypothetical protein